MNFLSLVSASAPQPNRQATTATAIAKTIGRTFGESEMDIPEVKQETLI